MSSLLAHRLHLAIIDPVTEITIASSTINGSLILGHIDDSFQLFFIAVDPTSNQRLSTIMTSTTRFKDDPWKPNSEFKVECSHITKLQIHPNPLSIELFRTDKPPSRRFRFSESDFVSLTEFIERVLIYGIAVPTSSDPYSLHFYDRIHPRVYPYPPPHIQLSIISDWDLSLFWQAVETFFERLMIYLYSSETLPQDPLFPLGIGAQALHRRVLSEISVWSESIPEYAQIAVGEWDSLFDSEGRLTDPDLLNRRLFHAGIDEKLLPMALPFIFKVWPLNSTTADRQALQKVLDDEFHLLVEQASLYDPKQIENNRKLSSAFRVIQHDVGRTDRQLPAFINEEGPGLLMVTRLLHAYCVFNPPIGYLQGMNDLFVPILMSFLPNWNEESYPIDDDGKVIDHQPYLGIIFWCFEAMLRNVDHLDLLANVTDQCKKQAGVIGDLLMKVSPLAAIWMHRSGLRELLWLYADFVLLFKRSFSDDVWPVWLKLNCAPDSQHWLVYFVTAILVLSFDALRSLPNVQITTLMERFPQILRELDLREIGKTALWLAEKVPFPIGSDGLEGQGKQYQFKFFETGWTGESETTKQYDRE